MSHPLRLLLIKNTHNSVNTKLGIMVIQLVKSPSDREVTAWKWSSFITSFNIRERDTLWCLIKSPSDERYDLDQYFNLYVALHWSSKKNWFALLNYPVLATEIPTDFFLLVFCVFIRKNLQKMCCINVPFSKVYHTLKNMSFCQLLGQEVGYGS